MIGVFIKKINKILITGSSGFIGSNLARSASKEGYEVIGFDRNSSDLKGINSIKGSITNANEVKKAMNGVDAVIHLAAVTSNVEFEKDLKKCYDTNVNGFLNVIDAAVEEGCTRFAYASSAAVYNEGSRFSEDEVINLHRQKSHYAKTKIMNEMVAASYSDRHGISALGLRFFNVYGIGENDKGNYSSIMAQFLRHKRNGEKLLLYGDGRQARDFINVEDVSKITMELLGKNKTGIYNVGTGIATPYEEIAEIIDPRNKEYVQNPLSSYQLLTKSDNRKLFEAVGNYKFVGIKEGILQMEKNPNK